MYFLLDALSEACDHAVLIRIIGVGSPFGDDAVGLEVARHLRLSPPLNCEIVVADRPGANLIEMLDGADATIVIDAVHSGAAVGTLHLLSFDQVGQCAGAFVSSHDLGIAAALELARKLGRTPTCGKVLGIEIGTRFGRAPCGLSQSASRAVELALAQLRSWIKDLNLTNSA